MKLRWIVAALAATTTLACGGTQSPRDEALTADEHDQEAEREEAAADDHEAQVRGVFYATDVYDPSDAHTFEAGQHREHAEAHRARAAQLRSFEEAECAEFPPETRASCPLLLDLTAIDEIEGGARLTFSAEREIEPVIDHIRCHIAFAAAQGVEGIDSCALYVPGTSIAVQLNVVELTTDQPEHVADLRRRVAVQAPAD